MKRILVGLSLVAGPILFACGPTQNPGSGGAAGTGGQSGNPFCGVKSILTAKCISCHSDPPNSGAPMPLTTFASTQATRNGQPVWQAMQTRVAAGTMPPANAPQLTAAEKATLSAWFSSGAGGSECGEAGSCETDPSRCVGEQYLPCTVTHRIRAHGDLGKDTKYNVVGGAADEYTCFYFNNPFYGTNKLITGEAPVIDNPAVVHHYLLFGSFMPHADGSIERGGCVGPEIGASQLLSGWAPGGTNMVLPNDIGMTINDYPYFQLQLHYNNPSPLAGPDATGVAYCATDEQKPNVAGIVTLGTDNLLIGPGANNVVGGTGTCPQLNKTASPLYVIGSSPHMHKLGSGFTTEIIRGGQRAGYISNIPNGTWRFDGQTHYSLPRIQLNPGDTLKTTCTYTNPGFLPVAFGTRTTDEMCYDFVMVYPVAQSKRECGQGITFSNQ